MDKYRPKSATVNHINNPFFTKNQNNFQNGFHKTFFIQEKEKGDKYFRSTRVGSCRRVVVKNGLPFALTFKVRNPRGEPMTHFNYTLKQLPKNPSSYFVDYCTKKEGKGIYYYHNGDRSMGDYHYGEPIGKHVMLTKDGEVKIYNY